MFRWSTSVADGGDKERGTSEFDGSINIRRRFFTLLLRRTSTGLAVSPLPATATPQTICIRTISMSDWIEKVPRPTLTHLVCWFPRIPVPPSSLSSCLWQDANRSRLLSDAVLLEFGVHAIRGSKNSTPSNYSHTIDTAFDGGIYRPGSVEGIQTT